MYRVYAHDAEARINLGIRRRLAPLLGNNRRRIELMNGLLFSLPGTPVLYYGDEIGMGDNIYLGDRNGVRTPMQWSGDRNAGFSQANPQRLYLPVIIDPEYHYETVNVEAQQNNPHSLLWWMKRLIALRKRYKAFGRGTIEFLYPENRKVLAFVRRHRGRDDPCSSPTCRGSCSTSSWTCQQFKGTVPVEMFGRTRVSAGRRLALLPHARPARLLLVLARAGRSRARDGDGASSDDSRPGTRPHDLRQRRFGEHPQEHPRVDSTAVSEKSGGSVAKRVRFRPSRSRIPSRSQYRTEGRRPICCWSRSATREGEPETYL